MLTIWFFIFILQSQPAHSSGDRIAQIVSFVPRRDQHRAQILSSGDLSALQKHEAVWSCCHPAGNGKVWSYNSCVLSSWVLVFVWLPLVFSIVTVSLILFQLYPIVLLLTGDLRGVAEVREDSGGDRGWQRRRRSTCQVWFESVALCSGSFCVRIFSYQFDLFLLIDPTPTHLFMWHSASEDRGYPQSLQQLVQELYTHALTSDLILHRRQCMRSFTALAPLLLGKQVYIVVICCFSCYFFWINHTLSFACPCCSIRSSSSFSIWLPS